ncbi:hypothetical protein QF042_002479 [Pedobacter sp. W3I1]|uniref:hypothetical protein n=1 Tax=Pedobacter sp. W3I1 TaxID=3042291 RepID=UPI00278B6B70|nr:hypothetical protein [Pedobacter sp. W3I1]MDQ0638914.1 hypothetical protein [Pedobacter sp. W3I1]
MAIKHFVANHLGMSQAVQGSGYPLQSFVVLSTTLKLTTKGFPLLSLMQTSKQFKNRQLYVCTGHLNPMARMPIAHNCSFYQQLSAEGTAGQNQTEELMELLSKKTTLHI